MSRTGSAVERDTIDSRRSKDLPWFHSKIGDNLAPAGRRLLEEYSGIPPSEVEGHIYSVRDRAWEIFPWPCIGEFWFITLGLSLHPCYPSLLMSLRSPTSPKRLLDLGTCLGQDLRKLIHDGVPPGNLYGADLYADFEKVGHELFRDASTFQNHFIAADLFDEGKGNALIKTEGTWDVISACMFLHVFSREKQWQACRRILKLLSRKPSSLIIGAQTGSMEPGERVLKPPFAVEGQRRTIFRQSRESFTEMWHTVGREVDVKLKVKVEYDGLGDKGAYAKEAGGSKDKDGFFTGKSERRLFFIIQVE